MTSPPHPSNARAGSGGDPEIPDSHFADRQRSVPALAASDMKSSSWIAEPLCFDGKGA